MPAARLVCKAALTMPARSGEHRRDKVGRGGAWFGISLHWVLGHLTAAPVDARVSATNVLERSFIHPQLRIRNYCIRNPNPEKVIS